MKFRRSSKATLTCNTRLLFSFVLSFRVTDICKLIIEQLVIVTYDLTCDSTRAQYPRDLRSKLFHLHDDLIFEFILSRFLFSLLSLSLSVAVSVSLRSWREREGTIALILVFPRRFPRVYSSGVEKQKLEAYP